MLAITIEEVQGRGRYRAQLADGSPLLSSSRQPFLDGARELLKRGIDPATRIVLRRVGSSVDSLRSTVGAAAKLTVQENDRRGPRFGPWISDSGFWRLHAVQDRAKAFVLSHGTPDWVLDPPWSLWSLSGLDRS